MSVVAQDMALVSYMCGVIRNATHVVPRVDFIGVELQEDSLDKIFKQILENAAVQDVHFSDNGFTKTSLSIIALHVLRCSHLRHLKIQRQNIDADEYRAFANELLQENTNISSFVGDDVEYIAHPSDDPSDDPSDEMTLRADVDGDGDGDGDGGGEEDAGGEEAEFEEKKRFVPPPPPPRKVVQYEYDMFRVYENERKLLLGKFSSKKLLPTDRQRFSDASGRMGFNVRSISDIQNLPPSLSKSGWELDPVMGWALDRSGDIDEDGWSYAVDFPLKFTSRKLGKMVRRRCWVRRVRRVVSG